MTSDWRWINLPGGFVEEAAADLAAGSFDGAGQGRGCIIIQTNATSSFHVIFSCTPALPSRGTDNPVLRFVVGKRKNSMTSVGLGNPYMKKDPIDFTKSPDALLTDSEEKSRTYWFLYDRAVSVAAMGVQGAPQADLCRLACRFRDAIGFRAEACDHLQHVAVSSGKRPVSLRIIQVCGPPDISIPRYRFDAEAWDALPWQGSSCVFEVDEAHRRLVEKVQQLLAASPIAPFYGLVEPKCLCLNAYRLLDPLRRNDLFPGAGGEDVEWPHCYTELHHRLRPVLDSAPWTYWPLRFDRADCTTITLAPSGPGCQRGIQEWCKAVQGTTKLRNSATNREMLTLTFAFEVFPVEGENAAQVRRDLVREITAMLEREWAIMEFRCPQMVCWQTHTAYSPYDVAAQAVTAP